MAESGEIIYTGQADYSQHKKRDWKSLEGTIVTSRKLRDYTDTLGFDPTLLNNETVLNFGSGRSMIAQELLQKGIHCNLVDLDIQKNSALLSPVRRYETLPIRTYLRVVNPQGEQREKIEQLMKRITKTEGRTYVQYGGRNICFKDQAFDHVLALWSTYQIPDDAKEQVYREIFRVGKAIHLGPIFEKDFTILTKLANEMEFDVIACQSYKISPGHRRAAPFNFSSQSEYDQYVRNNPIDKRVKIPKGKDAYGLPYLGAVGLGGNTIVLKKRSI